MKRLEPYVFIVSAVAGVMLMAAIFDWTVDRATNVLLLTMLFALYLELKGRA